MIVDGNDFVTLTGLVKCYSPSGSESVAVEYLINRMRVLGYHRAYIDQAGNAVGEIGNGPRQIILLGHIDTVPGQIPPRVDGDIFYGRGSVDAKGSLSAFTDAVAGIDIPGEWRIIVIGAVDEEGDSKGAHYVKNIYSPEFTLIGEPSHWNRITLGYKGSASARIISRRTVFHSAGQGENACEAIFKIWERIKSWCAQYNGENRPMFDQVLVSLRGFQSDNNGFEEWAQMHIGARLPLDLPPQEWYVQLKKICEESNAEMEENAYAVPAYKGEKNSALVRAFMRAIRSQGEQPGFVLKSGTADMNVVAPLWKCPVVAYGPGDSALDHTPDEHISVNEYRQAVGVLRSVLEDILSISKF